MTVEVGRRLTLRADPPTHRFTPGALIGREHELAKLHDALRASTTDGRAILVGGDAGSGKTALLAAFVADVRRDGVALVEGACVEVESRRPFGAFADLVASCVKVFGSERVERSFAARGVALRQLTTAGLTPGASGGDRYQMHGAILGLVTDLTDDGPLSIFLEDLHWADEASLQLFIYLTTRLRDRPVLIVATYRTDELDRRHPLRPALADLRKSHLIEEVLLAPLDSEGTRALIHSRLGLCDPAPLDLREFRDLVHTRCEGNPLHTEETLDTLRQSGRLGYAEGAWTCDIGGIRDAIPASVADGVIARWARLSPAAQQVLLVASVVGHRFDLDLLANAASTPVDALAPLLHEAIDARLILEESKDRPFTFRHALTREALQLQLLRSERVTFHRRIAAGLEARGVASVHAGELAYHLEEAGEPAKASRHYEAAAREAASATDYAGAARSMERAIATAADSDVEQGRRQLELVGYLRLSGDDPRARRAATAALEIGERSGDARLQGRSMLELYQLDYRNSDALPAVEPLDRALALLEPLGPAPELARAHSARAAHSARTGNASAAMASAERAREIATAIARPAELAWATMQVALAWIKQGQLTKGIIVCREAIEIARRANLVDELYGALLTLRVQLVVAGASSEEQRDAQLQMRAVARSHGLGKQAWIVRELTFLFQEADWEGFLRLLPLVPQPELSDFDQPRLIAVFIAIARDGPDALGELDGIRMRAAYGNSAISACWAAELLLLAGRAAECVEFASTLRDENTSARHWGLIPASVVHAIGLFAARECGDPQGREGFISSLLTERPLPAAANFNRRHIALANGEIAESEGRIDDALAAYTTALDECERSQFNNDVMYLMTLIRKRLAELHLRRDAKDVGAAQAQLDAMLPFWQTAKATWYLGQLRTWAEGFGLAFPVSVEQVTTATSTPKQLTRRELEVARFVAQGLTNREIGARLGLSVRTAEGHVEQIREKLGFRTRAQIASWVTERYGAVRPS